MQRVNVTYALITDESKAKVLVVKNIGSSWSLPGGAVEEGESLEEAAIREVKEETGLDVKVLGIVAINETKFERSQNHVIFFVFRAEIVGGHEGIILPDEISEIAWIDINEIDIYLPYYNGKFQNLIESENEIAYKNEGTR